MKYCYSELSTAKPFSPSYAERGHGVPLAILAIAAGLASNAALGACSTAAGARLQANAASTCVAAGSYTGVGVTGNRGALTSLTGGVINAAAVTVPLSLNGVAGAYASDAGSQVNLRGGATISRTGTSTGNLGLHALNGGTITVDGPLSIDLPNGSGDHGVLTEGSGTLVTLNGPATITMESGAAFAPGIRALTGSAMIANGAVTINTAGGNRSDAITAAGSGTITLNGALDLTTSGAQASALKTTTAGSITYNGQATFNNSGVNGSGIRAVTGGIATANASSNTTINVTGVNGQGISSRDPGSQVNLAGAMLVNVSGATQADFPSGNLESYSAGLLADLGGAIASTGSLQINTTQATSYGALLTGSDSTITATGGGTIKSAGVAIGFLAGASQKASFDGFAINNTSGDLIQVNAATGGSSLALTNSTASVASGGKLLTVSNGSTFVLTANHSTLSGDIVTGTGSAVNMSLLSGSSLTGAIDPVTLTIDGASRWTMTGNSVLSGITLAGSIDFQGPGTTFVPKTLTVNGNWVGQNGSIALNTYLAGDGAASDRLVINGGAASGSSSLRIINVGGPGAAIVADGIEVVQTVNGATTAASAFVLAAPVKAGAYSYYLAKGGVSGGTSENWYLRNTVAQTPTPPVVVPPTTPPVTPADPTPSTGSGSIPLYRPEVPVYAAVASVARQVNIRQLDNFHDRQGEQSLLIENGELPAAWGRVWGSNTKQRQDGTVTPQFDGSMTGMQVGHDIYADTSASGQRNHYGVFAGFAHATGKINGFAMTVQNLDVGNLAIDAYSLGGYWTHVGPSGWYTDAVLMGNSLSADPRSHDGVGAHTHGNALIGSIEGGLPISLGADVTIEPQAQVIWQHLSFNDLNDGVSTVSFNNGNTYLARLGVRLQSRFETSAAIWRPYLRLNLLRSSGSHDTTTFDGTTMISSGSNQTAGQFNAGLVATINKSTSAFVTVTYTTNLSGAQQRTVMADAGMRWSW